MGNFLPVDIISNILSRLLKESLLESLLECSLVCKTWRNLIYNTDKLFAHMHSRLIYDQDSVDAVSSGKASFVYLSDSVKGHTLLKYMEYDDHDHEKPLKFGIAKSIPVPDHAPVEIIGSCNGLLCISVSSEKHRSIKDPIYICNPMTREFVYLPKLTNKFSRGDYVVSGFGYHPSINQYKVVRICCHVESKETPFVGRVQVYTLGSGEGWRNLEDITYKLQPYVSSEILVNEALHWLEEEDGQIVKFDLCDETFSVVPGPECINDMWGYDDFELRVLGGCLCIIQEVPKAPWSNIWSFKSSWSWEENGFDWGMREYSQGESSASPIAILKNYSRILYLDNDCNIYSQDLGGYNSKIIGNRHAYHSVRFVKSFVSLKALGEEEAKIMEAQELTNSS